jgi:hypothetical protein
MMHKKITVAFALFLAISAFIAWSSQAWAAKQQSPPAQPAGAQEPAQQQPAAPASAPDAAKAAAAEEKKPGFLEDAKPYMSDRHVAKGMECTSCHGDANPQKAVETAKCLECHKSYDELSKKTEDMSPNPHSNHIVDSMDLDCSSCHHAHKVNELYCNQCHGEMEMQRNSASLQPKVPTRLLALLHSVRLTR